MTKPTVSKLETTMESAEALLESAQLLHSSLDIDQLLRHLLRSVMGRLLVSKALIAVADDSTMRLALVRGTAKIVKGQEFDEQAARAAGIEVILPIGDETAPVGLLGLSNPPNRTISDGEMEFL